MYNATLRRLHVPISAMEKKYILHILCVCSLSYTACKAHGLYYIVTVACPALPYFSTLPH